jgi:translation initiation factor IF-1
MAAPVVDVIATNRRMELRSGVRENRTAPFLFNAVMKEEHIEIEGRVKTVLPGTMFRVELDNKHLVLATICGKMRKRFVRLTVGDRVKMQMSPYDLDKARITWRLR